MKAKFIKISIIVAILFALAFVTGCREKVEATEPTEPAPNEYETECYNFNIWEPNDTTVVSLDFIPTWPEYIELERDLVIDMPDNHSIGIYEITLEKGTKIYFKED